MPWRPDVPGERPTLGHYALDWIIGNLAAPDRMDYEPFVPTREQADFILRFYELDSRTGKRIVRRGVISRPRGWGKSPLLSALCVLEGLADIVPDGWDANGQPVGRPWRSLRTPIIQLAAVSERQTDNAWMPLLEMLDPDLAPPVFGNYPGLEPLETLVALPGRGKIEPISSSGPTVKGARAVFSVWDQTEEWRSGNGGHKLARSMADNAAKVGGSYIESPNAYTPNEDSVAERSALSWAAMSEGRARMEKGLLYDHREASPSTDLTDSDSILAGLRLAYGDSSGDPRGCVLHDPPCAPGWTDHDAHLARIWDPDADEQEVRGSFLNQITVAASSWLSGPEWRSCAASEQDDPPSPLADGELITLGFDGSRGRARGKPDATALIGCRVLDGHLFEVFVDEAEDAPTSWPEWSPNITLLESHLADMFSRFTVAAFYADPGRDWRAHVGAWEARYGGQVALKKRRDHPFEWWMTGGRAVEVENAVEAMEGAVLNRDLTHSGSPRLTAHVLQAHRRSSHGRLALGKASSSSIHKIDAAVAAVLAWQARLDAVAAGVEKKREKRTYQVKRVR